MRFSYWASIREKERFDMVYAREVSERTKMIFARFVFSKFDMGIIKFINEAKILYLPLPIDMIHLISKQTWGTFIQGCAFKNTKKSRAQDCHM